MRRPALQKLTVSVASEEARGDWHVVDAKDKILGRLAAEIAHRLKGKHKVNYTSHVDVGDNIVVINADHLRVTGQKAENKIYYRHTGYPGGIRSTTFNEAMAKSSAKVLHGAVAGMLPKTKLGRRMLLKLHVYPNGEHPHSAQQPVPLVL